MGAGSTQLADAGVDFRDARSLHLEHALILVHRLGMRPSKRHPDLHGGVGPTERTTTVEAEAAAEIAGTGEAATLTSSPYLASPSRRGGRAREKLLDSVASRYIFQLS